MSSEANYEYKEANRQLVLRITNRLKIFIIQLEMTQQKFAAEVGISYPNLNKMITMGSDFGVSNLVKMMNRFPELNVVWLLTGEGTPIQDGNSVNITNCRNNSIFGNINANQTDIINALLRQNDQLMQQLNIALEGLQSLQKQSNNVPRKD